MTYTLPSKFPSQVSSPGIPVLQHNPLVIQAGRISTTAYFHTPLP